VQLSYDRRGAPVQPTAFHVRGQPSKLGANGSCLGRPGGTRGATVPPARPPLPALCLRAAAVSGVWDQQ